MLTGNDSRNVAGLFMAGSAIAPGGMALPCAKAQDGFGGGVAGSQ
jgi:hypothetical protein